MGFMINNASVSIGVKVFFLNSSVISQFFNLEIIKQKYSGICEPNQLIEDLSTDWNMSIINRAYADLASIQLGETTELSLPIIDKFPLHSEDWYNITVLDIVEFKIIDALRDLKRLGIKP